MDFHAFYLQSLRHHKLLHFFLLAYIDIRATK